MNKKILSFIAIILIISLIGFEFFMSSETLSSGSISKTGANLNFSQNYSGLQFYPNMRYPSKNISYKIENCSLDKKNDFEYAAEILSNETVLNFYKVNSNEDISVNCLEKEKFDNEMFIAGEGGPTKVVLSGENYVIIRGEVLLIKKSSCPKPNVAIHEILHALGFDHSTNENNIMYNVSSCSQEIGDDLIEEINRIYSKESLPDLEFGSVSVIQEGNYLSLNVSIRNSGLIKSNEAKIVLSSNSKRITELNISKMEVGEGVLISAKNLKSNQKNINNLTIYLETQDKELDKENNLLTLKMNKVNYS